MPKNPAKYVTSTAPHSGTKDLARTQRASCENYSDLSPRCAQIAATKYQGFAKFLARTLKESRNSERTFQRFRATPVSHSAAKKVILSEPFAPSRFPFSFWLLAAGYWLMAIGYQFARAGSVSWNESKNRFTSPSRTGLADGEVTISMNSRLPARINRAFKAPPPAMRPVKSRSA
jgi:hypothetical protein